MMSIRNSIVSGQISYILPSGSGGSSKCRAICCRCGTILLACLSVISFLLILSVFWWPWGQNPYGNWDSLRMGRLQPVLVEQVRTLMVTANRSIHDPIARQLLRNLSKEDSETCYSPNCLHTGLTLLESMNFSVNPCEDFYEFACGSWSHSSGNGHSLTPSHLVNADQFSKINEKVIRATQRILEDTSKEETEIKTFLQAQKYYAQCKDLDELEKNGLNPLWSLLSSYGGWPILGDHFHWEEKFNWINLTADLQRLSCPSILSLEVKQHPTDPLQNAIYIVHPKFFLSREYLINPEKHPKILKAYKDFIIGVATEYANFGIHKNLTNSNFTEASVNKRAIETQAEEIIKFETSLAKLANDDVGRKTFRKAIYPVHKLQTETEFMTPHNPRHSNKIDWMQFLTRVFSTSGVEITEEERLVVHEVTYIRSLNPLLSFTSERTLQNYLIWRLLVTFTTGSTNALRKLNFNFFQVVFGMKRIPARTSTCATVVKDAFALAIGMKIVKGLTDVSSKKEVEDIVENVRVSMEHLLNSQQLGPSLLLIGISRKLSTLKHCIGYPSSFQNVSAIDHFYHSLDFRNDTEIYLNKYVRLRLWLFDKTSVTLRQPFDSDCWSGTSWANIGEAYAYYDTARNSINFPIGLLQAPFYRHNVPLPVNYGAIGAIIGHEISHSINFEGWIKVGLVAQLEDYWDCLLRHYSAYEVPELGPQSRVNGLRTRSENLADHLGLAASYWAYRRLYTKTGPRDKPKTLVGLDLFSPNQIFYLSFAHMWCVSGPEEWLADELESSSHTPGRYRVLGSLQNSEDFVKSWKCPRGSPMNPQVKCNTLLTASKSLENTVKS